MVDLPDKIDLEVEDRDIEEDVVKIMGSMHSIRNEFKEHPANPEEKLKEYGYLAYRLASGIEALTTEEDGLAEHLKYVTQELISDQRLMQYDPVQDGFWSKENLDFIKTLDRVFVAIAEDKTDNLEKKHHVVQAVKYLIGDKSLTFSPYYGGLKTGSLPFTTKSFYMDKRVNLRFERIDGRTIYFNPNMVSYLKPNNLQRFIENLSQLKTVVSGFGYERIVFHRDFYHRFQQINHELTHIGLNLGANHIEEELGIILTLDQRNKGSFNLTKVDLIEPFKNLCKIVPDARELYELIFGVVFKELKREERIIKDAKEKLLQGEYPSKEVRFYIAHNCYNDFLSDIKSHFWVKDKNNNLEDYIFNESRIYDAHSNYSSSLGPDVDAEKSFVSENWKKMQVITFGEGEDKDNIYIASTVFNTQLDTGYTRDAIRDVLISEAPFSEKVKDIANHHTFTHLIRIKGGGVVEDLEAMNWEDKTQDEQRRSD